MKIRYLLDDLPHDTLMRLCEVRNLSASRDEARRSRLAHSYGGEYLQFVYDLRKADLLVLLRGGQLTDVETGKVYRLWNAASYSVEQLQSFLLHIFNWDAAPISLGSFSQHEEEPPVAEPAPKSRGGAFDALTAQWSRPKKISRVFAMLGEPAPQPLREARFLELIDSLGRMGIETTLADGDGRPFRPGSARPLIDDKIRLRRNVGANVGRREKDREPARQVAIIQQEPDSSRPVPPPQPDEWLRALIRLRFLTAVPSADRHLQADWPHAFIEAALRGLSLPERKQRLLATACQPFVAGNHDADALIPDVLALNSREECDDLFDHFRRLNAGSLDYVEQVIQLVHEQLDHTGPSVVRSALPPTPPAERVAGLGAEHTNLNRPHPPVPATPATKPSQNEDDEKNVRSLGSLDDLFKTKR